MNSASASDYVESSMQDELQDILMHAGMGNDSGNADGVFWLPSLGNDGLNVGDTLALSSTTPTAAGASHTPGANTNSISMSSNSININSAAGIGSGSGSVALAHHAHQFSSSNLHSFNSAGIANSSASGGGMNMIDAQEFSGRFSANSSSPLRGSDGSIALGSLNMNLSMNMNMMDGNAFNSGHSNNQLNIVSPANGSGSNNPNGSALFSNNANGNGSGMLGTPLSSTTGGAGSLLMIRPNQSAGSLAVLKNSSITLPIAQPVNVHSNPSTAAPSSLSASSSTTLTPYSAALSISAQVHSPVTMNDSLNDPMTMHTNVNNNSGAVLRFSSHLPNSAISSSSTALPSTGGSIAFPHQLPAASHPITTLDMMSGVTANTNAGQSLSQSHSHSQSQSHGPTLTQTQSHSHTHPHTAHATSQSHSHAHNNADSRIKNENMDSGHVLTPLQHTPNNVGSPFNSSGMSMNMNSLPGSGTGTPPSTTSSISGSAGGGAGDDDGDKANRRLARKAELARASRRRKKQYVQDLESQNRKLKQKLEELQQMKAQSAGGSKASSNSSRFVDLSKEDKFRRERQKVIRDDLNGIIQKADKATAEDMAAIEDNVRRFVTISRERQTFLELFLNGAEECLTPSLQVKFALWGLDQSDDFYEKPGLWQSLMHKEVGLNEQQMALLLHKRRAIREERRKLAICEQMLKETKEKIGSHIRSLNGHMDDIQSVMTPLQLAKFFLWIDNNEWVLQMLNSMFTANTFNQANANANQSANPNTNVTNTTTNNNNTTSNPTSASSSGSTTGTMSMATH